MDTWIQLISNGFVAACIYILVGVSFSLIFQISRFFNFAHGVVFTAGAYFLFLFCRWWIFPIGAAFVFSIVLSIALGCLIEILVYRPLKAANASSLILLLSSLGLYIILQNLISLIFGDDTKTVRSGAVKEGFNLLGARITSVQLLTISVSLTLLVLVVVLLRTTKIGQAMRAVSNDPALASISGISCDKVILSAFATGSALAGVAGMLVAMDIDMTPTMGMNALLMGVVAVIIGGVGSIPGLVFGALLLGMAQQLGVWKITATWQDAVTFLVLLLFLIFKPEGFLGKKTFKQTM